MTSSTSGLAARLEINDTIDCYHKLVTAIRNRHNLFILPYLTYVWKTVVYNAELNNSDR